jgi:predicted O-methyltransferase YrrM
MSEAELEWLAETAQSHFNIVEVGSWKGRSSLAIAQHMRGELFCVDAWIGMQDIASGLESTSVRVDAARAELEFHKNLDEFVLSRKVRIVKEESIAGAEFLLKKYGEGSMDWVFIDGDHSYETVKAEIVAYLPLLKRGGLMSGHDMWFDGVYRAVSEIFPARYNPGGTTIWCKEV